MSGRPSVRRCNDENASDSRAGPTSVTQPRAAFAAAFSFFLAFFSLTESLGLLLVFGACCPFAISMTSKMLGAPLADGGAHVEG